MEKFTVWMDGEGYWYAQRASCLGGERSDFSVVEALMKVQQDEIEALRRKLKELTPAQPENGG